MKTVYALRGPAGAGKSTFIKEIESENIHSLLMAEINQARSLPIQGFPSLVIENKGNYHAIPVNYLDWESTYQQIVSHI